MALRPPLAPVRAKPRRRKREAIPEEVQREVLAFGERLEGSHGAVFAANPRMKRAISRLLASILPPLPRPPGRPGFPEVTKAGRLFDELRRAHPGEPYCSIWRRIYPAAIEGYSSLDKLERRAAEQELRDRVRWRRRWRRRSLKSEVHVGLA
jgi:hypothetical protein